MPDISFDDLIPAQKAAPNISFDDLIPQPSAREKFKAQIRSGGDESGNYPGTQTPVPGFFGLLARKVADPFGVQDELSGAGRYVGSIASDLAHGQSPDWKAANAAYSDTAERIRAEQEVARERLGWGGNLLAEIAGGSVFGLGNIARTGATSLLSRIGQSARGGATFGALYGAGHAEGGPLERVEGAATGAGYGAVLGPALI